MKPKQPKKILMKKEVCNELGNEADKIDDEEENN